MRPLGHLVTTSAFSGGLYAVSGSLPLAGAALVGGVLIDLDHYLDYLCFNGRQHPSPFRFLHFYETHQYKRIVLLLHSWEFLIPWTFFELIRPTPILLGLWMGCIFHFALDLGFNGPRIHRPFAFYSFFYRWAQGFEKDRLIPPVEASASGGSV